MYFCANLTPSLFFDEGYLFWKMNVDKFENMGECWLEVRDVDIPLQC